MTEEMVSLRIFVFIDCTGLRIKSMTWLVPVKNVSKKFANLRPNWARNPEEVLAEQLKAIGMETEILKTDEHLFKIFRNRLYRRLNRKFHPLLDLFQLAHIIWQVDTVWKMIK